VPTIRLWRRIINPCILMRQGFAQHWHTRPHESQQSLVRAFEVYCAASRRTLSCSHYRKPIFSLIFQLKLTVPLRRHRLRSLPDSRALLVAQRYHARRHELQVCRRSREASRVRDEHVLDAFPEIVSRSAVRIKLRVRYARPAAAIPQRDRFAIAADDPARVVNDVLCGIVSVP